MSQWIVIDGFYVPENKKGGSVVATYDVFEKQTLF